MNMVTFKKSYLLPIIFVYHIVIQPMWALHISKIASQLAVLQFKIDLCVGMSGATLFSPF